MNRITIRGLAIVFMKNHMIIRKKHPLTERERWVHFVDDIMSGKEKRLEIQQLLEAFWKFQGDEEMIDFIKDCDPVFLYGVPCFYDEVIGEVIKASNHPVSLFFSWKNFKDTSDDKLEKIKDTLKKMIQCLSDSQSAICAIKRELVLSSEEFLTLNVNQRRSIIQDYEEEQAALFV